MSDHESESSPTGSGVESEASAPFSTNGSDPSGSAIVTAYDADDHSSDGVTFLADLARAMQSTAAAEQARNAEGTEQRRQSHVDAIRAREALEAEQLREVAKEDVKGIDAWSDGEIKRVKLERERRIAARREQLQVRLEEHRTVVAREVQAVEDAVASYRAEIDEYFRRLESETDPVAIAKYAGNRPAFPALERIGPEEKPSISTYAAAPLPAAAVETPVADEPGATDGSGETTVDAPTGAPEPSAGAEPSPASETESTVNEASESPDASDGSEEPVAVLSEARVLMPRTGGAGSWLRWPKSSGDNTDSDH